MKEISLCKDILNMITFIKQINIKYNYCQIVIINIKYNYYHSMFTRHLKETTEPVNANVSYKNDNFIL